MQSEEPSEASRFLVENAAQRFSPMARLLSAQDIEFMNQELGRSGRSLSMLETVSFRIGRARVLWHYAGDFSREILELLRRRAAGGESMESVFADRVALFRSLTRVRALAVAYSIGLPVEASVAAHVREMLKRHVPQAVR